MSAERTLLVAGAGIAGLAAALAAARAGLSVDLFERSAVLSEVGAGLQITPNVSRILSDWGLAPAIEAQAVHPNNVIVRDYGSARTLATLPVGRMSREEWGAPWWVLHRADLHTALLNAVKAHPAIRLHLDTTIGSVHVNARGTELLANGLLYTASGLVSADGVRSQVRGLIGDDAPPSRHTRIALRATVPLSTVPAPFATNDVGLWLGPDAHLVHYPLRCSTLFNMVLILGGDQAMTDFDNHADRAQALDALARWSPAVRQLVETAEQWRAWPLLPRKPWLGPSGQAALLIGDASHAMYPFLAQGAAMGIEDAAVMGQELARSPDNVTAAMDRTRQRRTARVQRVHQGAIDNGHIYHMSGPMAFARNTTMALLGGERLLRRTGWIYEWTLNSPK